MMGVPAIRDSAVERPNPSLEERLIVTSAMLYRIFILSGGHFISENMTLYSGQNASLTAIKSVPASCLISVCNKSKHFSASSFERLSQNALYANIILLVLFLWT